MIKIDSAAAAQAAISPAPPTAAAGAVRFVAVPGSGLEEVFPRLDNLNTANGKALPPNGRPKTFISAAADVSFSTESPSLSGSALVADGDGGGARARTASASTQAPELRLSDWVSARSR